MLDECALIPDIFDSTSYSSQELCDVHLSNLKEYLLQEALIRDLRNGEWKTYVSNKSGWHPRAKEIIEKLALQKRLRPSKPATKDLPINPVEWCQEALASHKAEPLDGIVASKKIAEEFRSKDKNIVASIEKLFSAPWWQSRREQGCSRRLQRNTDEYLKHLRLVLSHANSFMFIDPHLDPTRNGYEEFIQVLQAIQRPEVVPLIEIHRVCYIGSGPKREVLPEKDWEQKFRDKLEALLKKAKLTVEVFVWDDFHDRYLITDIVGIGMQNGFDVSDRSKTLTTWFRLGRRDRDDIQREFDPAAKRHVLRHRFRVGCSQK